jgi:hypothetical protein
MSGSACAAPLGTARLLPYWLGELDRDREEQVDEHLLGCGECAAQLEELIDLGGEIRACVQRGVVSAVVTDAFLRRLASDWVRVREYRVPRNGSVHCTVSPDDDVVVARMEAPLSGVERLDVVMLGVEDASQVTMHDVPFDPAAGEVVLLPNVDDLRALPACTQRMQLVAVEAGASRLLGEYGFIHTPWPERR